MTLRNSRIIALAEVNLITTALVSFSYFIHYPAPVLWLGYVSLFIAALLIARHIQFPFQYHKFIGEFLFSKKMMFTCIWGLILGILMACIYRYRLAVNPIPPHIGSFMWIAALIGISEELVFRGFILGHLSRFSVWVSIPVASLSHSLYKCCAFLSPIAGHSVNIPLLFVSTFIGGLFFGWLKEYSRSTIPPAIAHGIFDIIVYAEYVKAPWWVW
jgi:membrane protease YdiL (CAAX protease family)